MAKDNITVLYNALQGQFSNLGTEDEFRKRLDKPENRSALYNAIQGQFSNLGREDELSARLGYGQTPTAPAAPKAEEVNPDMTAEPAAEIPEVPADGIAPADATGIQQPAPAEPVEEYKEVTDPLQMSSEQLAEAIRQEQKRVNASSSKAGVIAGPGMMTASPDRLKAAGKQDTEYLDSLKREQRKRKKSAVTGRVAEISDHYADVHAYLDTAEDNTNTRTAKAFAEDTRRLAEAPSSFDGRHGFANFAKGMGEGLTDIDTYTAGVTDLIKMKRVQSVAEKMGAGEYLTDDEQALLRSYCEYLDMQEARTDLPMGYQAGKSTAESVPFTVQMMLTAGAGALATRGLLKAAQKFGTEATAKKMAGWLGKKVSTVAGKTIVEDAAEGLVRQAGRAAAEIAIQTAVMPGTYSGIAADKVDAYLDGEDYNFLDFARSFSNAMLETATEKSGFWIEKGLSKVTGIVAPGNRASRIFGDYIQSPVGEFTEELVASPVNLLRSLNPLYDKESNQELRHEAGSMWSPEQLGITFLSVLPMSLVGAGAHSAAAGWQRTRLPKTRQGFSDLLQESGATAEQAGKIISSIESETDLVKRTQMLQQLYNSMMTEYLDREGATESSDKAKEFDNRLNEVIGGYNKSLWRYDRMVDDVAARFAELPEDQKQQAAAEFEANVQRLMNNKAIIDEYAQSRGVTADEVGKVMEADPEKTREQIGIYRRLKDARQNGAEGYSVRADERLMRTVERIYSKERLDEFAADPVGLISQIEDDTEKRNILQYYVSQEARKAYEQKKAEERSKFEAEKQEQYKAVTDGSGNVVSANYMGGAVHVMQDDGGTAIVVLADGSTQQVSSDQVTDRQTAAPADLLAADMAAYDASVSAVEEAERNTPSFGERAMVAADLQAGEDIVLNVGGQQVKATVQGKGTDGITVKYDTPVVKTDGSTRAVEQFTPEQLAPLLDNDFALGRTAESELRQTTEGKLADLTLEANRQAMDEFISRIGESANVEHIASAEEAKAKNVPGYGASNAVYHNGKTYIFDEMFRDKTRKQSVETVIHELVAHSGTRALLGTKFDSVMDRVWRGMDDEMKGRFTDYAMIAMLSYGDSRMKGYNEMTDEQKAALRTNMLEDSYVQRMAADEYVAHLAEGIDLTDEEKTIWQEIIDAVTEFINSMLDKEDPMTRPEVEQLIRSSYKAMRARRETGVGVNAPAAGQTVQEAQTAAAVQEVQTPAAGQEVQAPAAETPAAPEVKQPTRRERLEAEYGEGAGSKAQKTVEGIDGKIVEQQKLIAGLQEKYDNLPDPDEADAKEVKAHAAAKKALGDAKTELDRLTARRKEYADALEEINAAKAEAAAAPEGQAAAAPRRKPSNGFGGRRDPNAAIQDKFQEERSKFQNADPKTNIYAKVLQESETWEDAAAELERLAKEQDAIAEDWASRKYKTNNAVVTGNNANSAADEYETTIGAANERRRRAAVSNARKEAENLRGYADTLRKRVGAPAAPKGQAPIAPSIVELIEPENPVVSQEEFDEAAEFIRNYLNGNVRFQLNDKTQTKTTAQRNKEHAMVTQAGLTITGFYLERGVRSFEQYAEAMVKNFGKGIRPWLKAFYQASRYSPLMQDYVAQMDPQDIVDKFDIDNYELPTAPTEAPAAPAGQAAAAPTEAPAAPKSETPIAPEAKPAETPAAETKPAGIGPVHKSKNTKTNADIWVVKPEGERVDGDTFDAWKEIARRHGGYYSNFRDNRGFTFKSEEQAKAFNEEAASGLAPAKTETPAQERDKNIEKLRTALDSAREAYNRYRSGKAKEEALERVIALENQLAELTGENSNSRTAKQALKEGPLDENESYPEEGLTKDDVNRLLSKYEPEDLYEHVLFDLAGKRFIWGNHPHNGTKGLGAHLFGREEPGERNKRISWRASREKGGLYPEEVAERIYEGLPVSLAEQTDYSTIFSIILDELRANHSPAGVLRELAGLYREREKVANNEFTREAWAAARNRIAVIKAEEAAENAADAAWLTGRELTDEEWAEYQELAESLYDETDDAWLNSHILSDEDYDALIQTDEKTNIFDRNNQDNNGNDTRGEGDTRGPGETPVHGSGETGSGMGKEGRQDAAEGSDGGSQEGQEGASGNAGDAGVAVRGASVPAENGTENAGRLSGRESAGGGQAGRAESVTPLTAFLEPKKEIKPQRLEDFGEKIGGARKDIVRKYADRINLSADTFSKMFPAPDIQELLDAGLSLDKAAAVKALYDMAKGTFKRDSRKRSKSFALGSARFYAMYAKDALLNEIDYDKSFNGFVFTDYGKEYAKVNIAAYQKLFSALGTDYAKVDLSEYAIDPVSSSESFRDSITRTNEANRRDHPERNYKDGSKVKFVFREWYKPENQFEEQDEAVDAFVERIKKEVDLAKVDAYEIGLYYPRDSRGMTDYSKCQVCAKIRGFGAVELISFDSENEARQWLREHAEDAQQMAAAKKELLKNNASERPLPKYSIGYERQGNKYLVIAKFSGKKVILKEFSFKGERNGADYLKTFKDEVLPYMDSQEARDAADEEARKMRDRKGKSRPEQIKLERQSRERNGKDWRGGQDVTPEMMVDMPGKPKSTFGFRAVEFGNYVTGKERQEFLNDVYDALMDLSELTGLSPRALSLNGKLAIAIGARGTSGASGHYEPQKNVINITKTSGRGVLAHEWLHALDTYFSSYDPEAAYIGKSPKATTGDYKEDMRPEMIAAYENLMSAIRSTEYADRAERLGEYWASETELASRAFQDYVMRHLDSKGQKNDFLSNHVPPEDWAGSESTYPFPLGDEVAVIDRAFDNLFSTIEQKEENGQMTLYQLSDDYIKREVADDGMTRFQLIGAKGAQRLDYDDEKGTRIDNLAVARVMEDSGKDSPAIWFATGWQRGADGRWKYEIPDGKFRMPDLRERLHEYNADPRAFGYERFKWRLPELYDNPDLYKAYPSMEWLDVRLVGSNVLGRNVNGRYAEGANSIDLNVFDLPQMASDWEQGKVSGAVSEEAFQEMTEYLRGEIETTLIHEIQHAVQEQEAFARGSSPKEMEKIGNKALSNEEKALKGAIDKIRTVMRRKGTPSENLLKEFAKVPMEQLTDDVMTEVRSALMKPISFEEAVAVARKYFNLDDYDEVASSQLSVIDIAYRDRLLPAIIQKQDVNKRLRSFLSVVRMGRSPIVAYRAVAGEVEARNAARRSKMSEEYRKGNPPSSTEDVARKDQIVMFQLSDKAYMAAVEKGDMETASAMVREAFLKAYPNTKVIDSDGLPKVMYHGTDYSFNAFLPYEETGFVNRYGEAPSNGYLFTDNQSAAEDYGETKEVYLNAENVLEVKSKKAVKDIVEAKLQTLNSIAPADWNVGADNLSEFIDKFVADDGRLFSLAVDSQIEADECWSAIQQVLTIYAKDNGYDALKFKDSTRGDHHDTYAVFESPQIKSADPVTYDDNGDVIPLSERFSPSDDIRYQLTPNYLHRDEVRRFSATRGKIDSYQYNGFIYAIKANPLYDLLNSGNSPVGAYRRVVKDITLDNYFIGTAVDFKPVIKERRSYDAETKTHTNNWEDIAAEWDRMKESGRYTWHKSPLSDSEYLTDEKTGDIYRCSDHWGGVASCDWTLGGVPSEHDLRYGRPYVIHRRRAIAKANIKDFTLNGKTTKDKAVDPARSAEYGEALNQTLVNYRALRDGNEYQFTQNGRSRLEQAIRELEALKVDYDAGGIEAVADREVRYQLTPKQAEQALTEISRSNAKAYDPEVGTVRFQITKRTAESIDRLLAKNPNIDARGVAAFKTYVEHEETPAQLAMAKWFGKGSIRLPEDKPLVDEALKTCRKMKMDPMAYNGPGEIVKDWYERIRPEVEDNSKLLKPEAYPDVLTNKVDYGNGITVYNVADTREGQQAVRDLMNDHLTVDGRYYNCWCLEYCGESTGELADTAIDYWGNYSACPKRVAFYNGRIVAFCASADSDTAEWWDLSDNSHGETIPVTMPIPGDAYARSSMMEFDESSKELTPVGGMFSGNKKNGLYREWNPKGVLVSSAHYKGRKLDGLYEVWDDSGQMVDRVNFKDGKKDGLHEEWYSNGNPRSRTNYKDGVHNGIFESWYVNGQLAERKEYQNGRRNGQSERWYENGQIKYRSEFKDELQNGLREEWYENGQMASRKEYEGGRENGLVETWYENGQMASREEYKDYEKNGLYESWYANGQIKHRSEYKNGYLNGLREEWYENGQMASRKEYEGGRENGLVETWYENGQIKYRSEFKDGLQNGLLEEWYENGQLASRKEYKDGMSIGISEEWHTNGQLASRETNDRGEPYGLEEFWYTNGKREALTKFDRGVIVAHIRWGADGELLYTRLSEAEQRALVEQADAYDAEMDQMEADALADEIEANEVRYSLVEDADLLERLNNGEAMKVYRAAQIIDGEIYPPMSAKVKGKFRAPIRLGRWEQSEENPEIADDKGYFPLNKGNGKTIRARYNPYFHSSPSPLNDQFSSAYERPNLIVMEVEVPVSELKSKFRAVKAKDTVGMKNWHAGPVSGKLPDGKKRTVMLSRWDRPIRIVPDSEVAALVADLLAGENLGIPRKVVTPSLAEELKKHGVRIVERNKDVRLQPTPDETTRFQLAQNETVVQKQARDRYEQLLQAKLYKMTENHQDSMRALLELQRAVSEAYGRELEDYENAYIHENAMSSKNKYQSDEYRRNYVNPLEAAVKKLIREGETRQTVIDYMMAKHGLERNAYMQGRVAAKVTDALVTASSFDLYIAAAQTRLAAAKTAKRTGEVETLARQIAGFQRDRAAAIKEASDLLKKHGIELDDVKKFTPGMLDGVDFAGLTQLTGDKEHFTELAGKMVEDFEKDHDAKDLWTQTNQATKKTLAVLRDGGVLSQASYEAISKMYENYIPLRGWDDKVAHDVWEYVQDDTGRFGSVMKDAGGRKSKADDPIAVIAWMGQRGIQQANRNAMKQKLLNLALNMPTDLMTVSDTWIILDPDKGEWRTAVADAGGKETVAEFEARMQKLELQGLAKRVRGKLDVPYRILPMEERQHAVIIQQGDKSYTVYINSDPRAAEAINGLLNPDIHNSPLMQKVDSISGDINRFLASNFTQRNPEFVLRNLSRDLLFSNFSVFITEDAKYRRKFLANQGLAAAKLPGLLHRRNKGKLDRNNPMDRMYLEFLENGGETGYTNIITVEENKRRLERIEKDGNSRINNINDMLDVLASPVDNANAWAEGICRFAAFLTSRESGRGIARSVWDAKDISVNFNKKGSGGDALSGWMRMTHLFYNAAVQGMAKFARMVGANPKRAVPAMMSLALGGFLIRFVNQWLSSFGGDGDPDDYYDLPETVRRNNICLAVGGTGKFITVPLSIEQRTFYGMGELLASWMAGKEKYDNPGLELVGMLADLTPVNPEQFVRSLKGKDLGGKFAAYGATMGPDALRTAFQLMNNEDYFGIPIYRKNDFNENLPAYRKAYKSTGKTYVSLAKFLNDRTGGNEYRQGGIDLNPAVAEHILESYFGGIYKTIEKGVNTAAAWVSPEDEVQARKMPIVSSFLSDTKDSRVYGRTISNAYYQYKEKVDRFTTELNGFKKEMRTGKDIEAYARHLYELNGSPDAEAKVWMDQYAKQLDYIRKMGESGLYTEEQVREESLKVKEDAVFKLESIYDNE